MSEVITAYCNMSDGLVGYCPEGNAIPAGCKTIAAGNAEVLKLAVQVLAKWQGDDCYVPNVAFLKGLDRAAADEALVKFASTVELLL